MTFWERQGAELRRMFSADTEDESIGVFRFHAAGLSVLVGILGLSVVVPLIEGELSWLVIPPVVLLEIGAGFGVAVWLTRDVPASRRYGLVAVACTVLGCLAIWLAA